MITTVTECYAKGKTKIHLVLLIFFISSSILLFASNYGEEARLNSVNDDFSGLCDDRLIAGHLINKITELLHRKQLLYMQTKAQAASGKDIRASFSDIQLLLNKLMATRLSLHEKTTIAGLQKQLNQLNSRTTSVHTSHSHKETMNGFADVFLLLNVLSDIQVTEGVLLKQQGQTALAGSMVGIKLQSAVFIILLLSFIAMTKQTAIKSKILQQHELN